MRKVYKGALNSTLAALGLLIALGLASCADRSEQTLTDACMKAGSSVSASSNNLARCQCAAEDAQKYLAADDYQLLVGFATIYNSNEPDDVKLHRLIDGMVQSGLTIPKASAAAADMILLSHRVAYECRAS